MTDPILERLKTLEAEYEAGQKMLAELDARRTNLMNTMLRIEGAIAVLKELSGEAAGANGSSPTAVDSPRLPAG
jgi:hypothetical protein